MYALTKIKGVGRRYSNLVCKKADVDLNKRYADHPSSFAQRSREEEEEKKEAEAAEEAAAAAAKAKGSR